METHGIPTELFFCDQPQRSSFQTSSTTNVRQHQQAAARIQRRDTANLQLQLDPDPLPECFGSLLCNTGQSPILGSPDLNLLRLGSPELERLIMSQPCVNSNSSTVKDNSVSTHQNTIASNNGCSLSRPIKVVSPIISAQDLQFITETNNALESLVNPQRTSQQSTDSRNTSLTSELESFQSSFIEPLQQVPDSQEDLIPPLVLGNIQSSFSSRGSHQYGFKFEDISSNSNGSSEPSFGNFAKPGQGFDDYKHVFDSHHSSGQFNDKAELEEEKDQSFMPSTQMNIGILPMPPIDLEVQEIVKRERKKLKNRVAASKCRKKKLEREAQLEIRVQHLKEKNIELSAVATALRQQSLELKQRILEHINAGCHMRIAPY